MNRFFTLLFIPGVLVCAYAVIPPAPFPAAPPASRPGTAAAAPKQHPVAALNDTIPPTIQCPPNDTIVLPPATCDTVYTYTVTAFDSLTPLTPILLNGLASGDTFPIGTTVNTFLAADSAGNFATCAFSVTVQAATATFTCKSPFEVYLGADCKAVPQAEDALLPPYGCAEGLVVEVDLQAPFGNGPWVAALLDANNLNKTYGYRLTHPLTGTKCTGQIHVQDSTPPLLECPEITLPCAVPVEHLSPAFLADSLGIFAGMPAVTEDCPGNVALNHVDVVIDLPCDTQSGFSGKIMRFWTALDASNNVATCVQTINRWRLPDDVFIPADILLSCALEPLPPTTGGPYVQVGPRQYPLLGAPLCEVEITYADSVETLCGGNRRIFRSWLLRDTCLADTLLNTASGIQTIEVTDDQLPVVHCPADTVVQVATQNCRGVVDFPDLVVSDACSFVTAVTAYWTTDGVPDTLAATLGDFPGNNPAASDTLAVFGTVPDFPAGATTLRFEVADACGNTASYEMILFVWDSLPPTAKCDSMLSVFLDDFGYASLPAGLPDNGSVDSCAAVYFKIRRQTAGNCDTPGDTLDDFINFCCADLDDTIPVLLRVYDVPLPDGPLPDSAAAGQYSDCTVAVRVIDTNPPKCKAPAPVAVTCDQFDPTLGSYGDTELSCRVDSSVVSIDYQLFDTACNQGIITRVFQVFDATGASGQCSQNITVSNEQHYFIRFPDDLIITMCDTAGQYGAPEFFGVQCEDIVLQFTENIVYGVPDACFKIERNWTVFNQCAYDPGLALVAVPNPEPHPISVHPDNQPGPVVSEPGTAGAWAPTQVKVAPGDPTPTDFSTFWSAGANGFQYKQVIKVIDLEQPLFANCPAADPVFTDSSDNNFSLWNGNYSTVPDNPDQDLCEGAADLSVAITDACFGPDLGVDYLLFLDLDDDGLVETVVSSTDLPQAGTVRYNNLNTPNYAGGETRQFDLRPVTGNEKYQFAAQTSASGRYQTLRLAWNTLAAPGNFIPLQLPLGNHRIRWTIYDGCGNENTCEYDFRVEDPDGTCAPTVLTVGGTIKTDANAGVNDVAIQVNGTHPNLPAFNVFALTNTQGVFSFEAPTGSSYTVTPLRNDDHLNGVSTFDLLLINKHVLGLTPLSSPYKIIAADANGSNTVTTFDIVELRKLILGLYQQLPSSTSWVFVPADHVFADPANPFLNGLPETQTVANLQPGSLPAHNFIGIKVGDINGNANPGISPSVPEDRSGQTLYFDLPDLHAEAGAELTVPVRAAMPVAGFQLTLDFPGLELLDIAPGPAMTPGHFAVFNDARTMAISWETGGQADFSLRFRAETAGRLRDLLRLSGRIVRPEAYSYALEQMPVALRFGGEAAAAGARFELYQNQPNPFSGATAIRFYLPEAETATLRVWDATGRLLAVHTQACPAGLQEITLDGAALGDGTGLLYYQLETRTGNAVRKMLRQ